MNIKERGITVGDLLIIIIIILTSSIFIKTFNKDKGTKVNQIDQENFLFFTNSIKTFPSA
tara:strand:+ start:85 stop:264 length:180 start_codon:yes stop_codon:yes gene_type:complete